MAGLKDKRISINDDRLALSEPKAVMREMKRWGVTQDQIATAHRKVGRMVKEMAVGRGRKR